jgi:hypothetical protein
MFRKMRPSFLSIGYRFLTRRFEEAAGKEQHEVKYLCPENTFCSRHYVGRQFLCRPQFSCLHHFFPSRFVIFSGDVCSNHVLLLPQTHYLLSWSDDKMCSERKFCCLRRLTAFRSSFLTLSYVLLVFYSRLSRETLSFLFFLKSVVDLNGRRRWCWSSVTREDADHHHDRNFEASGRTYYRKGSFTDVEAVVKVMQWSILYRLPLLRKSLSFHSRKEQSDQTWNRKGTHKFCEVVTQKASLVSHSLHRKQKGIKRKWWERPFFILFFVCSILTLYCYHTVEGQVFSDLIVGSLCYLPQ